MNGLRQKLNFKLLFFFIVLIVFLNDTALAEERILSFHSDISVHKDASLTVEETIAVKAEQNEIKRGIYRDFPTRYKDKFGNNHEVGFSIKRILKDGKTEPYHLKDIQNGVRIYIGKESVILEPGVYTYSIIYTTNRQLGFFEDHDELYWNVTGNDWAFPIEKASASVELPEGASSDIKFLKAFTGKSGSKEGAYKAGVDKSGKIIFTAKRSLNAREGFTIVAAWPKGFVFQPSQKDSASYFIGDNAEVVWSLAGLCLVFLYYFIVWLKVGRDPEKGTIIPIYSPPPGFSPAAARYIYKMKYDHKAFASAIVSMAVKGYITIKESSGRYTFSKTKNVSQALSADEKNIADKLLNKRESITFGAQSESKIMKEAVDDFKKSLKLGYEKIYFMGNRGYFAAGLILSFLAAGASVFIASNSPEASFMSIWLTIWTIGVTLLLYSAATAWKKAIAVKDGRISSICAAMMTTLFSAPFVGGELFGIYMLVKATSPLFAAILVLTAVVNYIFYHLLKSPTHLGRKALDMLEGFKLFLGVTEKDRLNFINPPDKTPELFEKYLPFALALDVENKWAEQFSEVFAGADMQKGGYHPVWYSGSAWDYSSIDSFASSLGQSIASTATSASAPGSSSGGGSGGSSGGGGGGGGGGGW